MKKNVLFLFAAIGLLASCAKEIDTPESFAETPVEEPESLFYVTVGISKDDPENKSSLSDAVDGVRKVEWSNTDQIRISGKASSSVTVDGEDASVATFAFIDPQPSSPFNVLYPGSIYKDATHVTLPAVQTYREGNIADGMFPMAGTGTKLNELKVHNLCAILKLSVKRASSDPDEDDIVAISFKGHDNEQVSGNFTIDYANATLTSASDAAADKVIKMTFDPQSTVNTLDFYLVIPARTYAKGFVIEIKDENGDIMRKGTSNSKTFQAGHLYPMREFDFEPTYQESIVSISSAADLVKFAQDYDNGNYDSPKIPTVTLTANISGFTDAQKEAFNTTGGIGSSSKKFHGTFDGNGKTISDLTVTAPLFSHIGPTGVVKNVELTATCSLTHSAAISADTNLGAIAGYSEGIISNCVNRGAVNCNSTSRTAGVLKIGGILGRQNASGTISDCVNHGTVTCTAPGTPDIYMGGIVGTVERPASGDMALIENCANHGAVKNGKDSDEPAQPCILHMGGSVGWIYSTSSSAQMTISGLENTGDITKTNNTSDNTDNAVLLGGIIGGIHGKSISTVSGIVEIKNSHVVDCTIKNGDFNTANGYGQASNTGGFVGVARGGTIRISDSHVRKVNLITHNMLAGGLAAVAQNTTFSNCNVLASSIKGSLSELRRGGGIVGFARGGVTISNCIVKLTSLQGGSTNDVLLGGIIGVTAGTNTINGCKAFVELMYIDGSNGSNANGWIVGKAEGTLNIKSSKLGGTYGQNSATITLNNTSDSDAYFGNHICGTGSPTYDDKNPNTYWDGTDAPSGTKTETISIANYASANGWTNGGTQSPQTVRQGVVTLTASDNGGSLNGNYNTQWRFYQARGGGLTVSVPIGYSLKSATFTYTIINTGVLLAPDGSTQITSGAKYEGLSGSSATFTVGNTGSATNGQVRFTNIVIEYE